MKTITLARKPLVGTVANNVLEHGSGGINIDASRIGYGDSGPDRPFSQKVSTDQHFWGSATDTLAKYKPSGRFPANLILKEEAAEVLDKQSGESLSSGGTNVRTVGRNGIYGAYASERGESAGGFGDNGGASRYFKQVKK